VAILLGIIFNKKATTKYNGSFSFLFF